MREVLQALSRAVAAKKSIEFDLKDIGRSVQTTEHRRSSPFVVVSSSSWVKYVLVQNRYIKLVPMQIVLLWREGGSVLSCAMLLMMLYIGSPFTMGRQS